MNKIVFLLVNALCLATVASARLSPFILGADRDEHGCITSAGYKWCEHMASCVSVNQLCVPPSNQ